MQNPGKKGPFVVPFQQLQVCSSFPQLPGERESSRHNQPGRAQWEWSPGFCLVITTGVLQGKELRGWIINSALLNSPAGGKVGTFLSLKLIIAVISSSIPEQDEATSKSSMTHLSPVDLSLNRLPLSQRHPIVCLGFIKYTLILQFPCFLSIYTHDAAKDLCIGLGKGGNSPW